MPVGVRAHTYTAVGVAVRVVQVEDARAAMLLYRLHSKAWESELRLGKRATNAKAKSAAAKKGKVSSEVVSPDGAPAADNADGSDDDGDDGDDDDDDE